jgi:hypothetical protein
MVLGRRSGRLDEFMAKCGYCGSTFFLSGLRSGANRFCSKKCQHKARLLEISRAAPADIVEREVEKVYRGNCPKCGQLGPIDAHKYFEVWSLIYLTRWAASQQISCRSCATKRQLGALFFSLFCGWWGVPWGLIITPMQIFRNIRAMWRKSDSSGPSSDLRTLIQLEIGRRALAASRTIGRGAVSQRPPPLPAAVGT